FAPKSYKPSLSPQFVMMRLRRLSRIWLNRSVCISNKDVFPKRSGVLMPIGTTGRCASASARTVTVLLPTLLNEIDDAATGPNYRPSREAQRLTDRLDNKPSSDDLADSHAKEGDDGVLNHHDERRDEQ